MEPFCKKQRMEVPLLNPMIFYPRFPHITECIFEKMNKPSLKISREVSKTWQSYIDCRNLLWNKILKEEGVDDAFISACQTGHIKMTKMLLQNPMKFPIDLNYQYYHSYLGYGNLRVRILKTCHLFKSKSFKVSYILITR